MSRDVAATRHEPSEANQEDALRSLTGVRPLYFLPQDPMADEVLIPGEQSGQFRDAYRDTQSIWMDLDAHDKGMQQLLPCCG